MKQGIIIILLIVVTIEAYRRLPSYLRPCRRNDPFFSRCFERNANQALPRLVKGDRYMNLNHMFPLRWPDDYNFNTPNMNMRFYDTYLSGLENMTMINPRINFNNRTIHYTLHCPEAIWRGRYFAMYNHDGITETTNGTARIVFRNGTYKMAFAYDTYKMNNTHYANITKANASIEHVTPDFNLENINKNKHIANEWEKNKRNFVSPDLGNDGSAAIADTMNDMFNEIPYNDLFPMDDDEI